MRPLLLAESPVVSFSSAVRADVVFSNLGPGDSFHTSSSYWLSGPDSTVDNFPLGNFDFATPFSVNHSHDFVLYTAELPLIYIEGTNSLTARLLADDAGFPGAVLASTTITGIPTSVSIMIADFSAAQIRLQAGAAYWLMGDANEDTQVVWPLNTTGQLGVAFNSMDSWEVRIESHPSPAVRINGTIVPEPSSLVLVGSTSLFLIPVARRAKRTFHKPRCNSLTVWPRRHGSFAATRRGSP